MANARPRVNGIEELRPVQEERFARQMDLVFQAHPRYSALFKEMGLARPDIKGLDDLPKIPLTRKEDYIARPDDYRLRMDLVEGAPQDQRILWDIIYTAGSTSDPARFYDTCYDHYARISQLKRTAEIAGIGPEDTVINLFPLTAMPHQGFLSVLWGAQAVGAKMISGFGGSFDAGFGLIRRSAEAIEMIVNHRVTVLWGIGFFLRRLIMRAQEMGADLSSVRLGPAHGRGQPIGHAGGRAAAAGRIGGQGRQGAQRLRLYRDAGAQHGVRRAQGLPSAQAGALFLRAAGPGYPGAGAALDRRGWWS